MATNDSRTSGEVDDIMLLALNVGAEIFVYELGVYR